MTIHHATIKRAEKLGINLTEADELVTAHYPKGNRTVAHSLVTAALGACHVSTRFAIEYPHLRVDFANTENTTARVFHQIDDGDRTDLLEFETRTKLEDKDVQEIFAEALEAAAHAGLDVGEDEDFEFTGTVVPERYRQAYKERGNENHCGDWLAEWCDGRFDVTTEDGKRFDHERFAEFLVENGVSMTGRWAGLPDSGQRGWQGRYRMNGRQRLEVVMAITGKLQYQEKRVKVPAEYMADLRSKHAKTIEKREKAAAKAIEDAKKADEEAKPKKK